MSENQSFETTKDFSRVLNGIVTCLTKYSPSQMYPNGTTQTRECNVRFQRSIAGENGELGNNDDISWDYLDSFTQNLIISELRDNRESGGILINGTRVDWYLN